MALVPTTEVKTYLGITDSSLDTFLDTQGEILSDAFELYCSRKFLTASYTQEVFLDELNDEYFRELNLYHYPIQSITSVVASFLDDPITDYRLISNTGVLRKSNGWFSGSYGSSEEDKITIQYVAGFDELPNPLKQSYFNLMNQAYQKRSSGIGIDFGSNVQRLSIPGTISVDFDYSLETNNRNRGLGQIIGNEANVLDLYRSERTMIGTVRNGHVY